MRKNPLPLRLSAVGAAFVVSLDAQGAPQAAASAKPAAATQVAKANRS